MIKKTMTYKNYNDEMETEDFYFNLSKGELVLMEMSAIDRNVEGMQDKLDLIAKTRDGRKLAGIFKEIVATSYGVRSHDGKRFIKNPENLEDFESTGAYSDLIVELATEADKAAAFINGLMPQDLRDSVKQEVAKTSQSARERSEAQLQGFQKKAEAPSVTTVPELPTSAPVLEASSIEVPKVDVANMTREELIAHYGAK
jgi:hypothetical protein